MEIANLTHAQITKVAVLPAKFIELTWSRPHTPLEHCDVVWRSVT